MRVMAFALPGWTWGLVLLYLSFSVLVTWGLARWFRWVRDGHV